MLSSRPGHVWLDGRLVPADEPHLHVTDRGFQLGDGLFETLRARRGVLIEWEEHLTRLEEGAEALVIPLPSGAILEAGVRELLDAEHLSGPGDGRFAPGDAAVRITISRGALERRGTLPPGWDHTAPTVAIQAWPYAPPASGLLERGVRAIASSVRRDPASPLTGIKATSRADYVYAKLEAERGGVDDALFLTLDGRVSEATSANVFAITGDALVTPTASAAILAGTTRTWLLGDSAVRELGVLPEERDLRPDDLVAADEAFLSSSVAGIVPLVALDGRPIGAGRPGPRTLELRLARERWIDETSQATSASG
jgi:branched-chain amino acid aminotransferase